SPGVRRRESLPGNARRSRSRRRVQMRTATLVTAAVLLSVSPVPAHAAAPLAETNIGAAPLEASYPEDALAGKWWTEGKEGLMKIEKTKSGRFQVILLGGKEEDKKDVN